jgi:dihydropteroate synthase
MVFKAGDIYFDLDAGPLIMGILNITPDSFSDGGRYTVPDSAFFQCEKMIKEGADIIDIGGESSRPGSYRTTAEEEMNRILPVLEGMKKRFETCISIDTYKPEVASAALDSGAHIINNIFGTVKDDLMADVIANYGAGYCIMHIKGTPETMQSDTVYADILSEIKQELLSSAEHAISRGAGSQSIIIDPGIGFGKDLAGNSEIIKNISYFADGRFPVLIGVSRKSFIGNLTGLGIEERLGGTIAANTIAFLNGAKIFRVHDVRENRSALDAAHGIMCGSLK